LCAYYPVTIYPFCESLVILRSDNVGEGTADSEKQGRLSGNGRRGARDDGAEERRCGDTGRRDHPVPEPELLHGPRPEKAVIDDRGMDETAAAQANAGAEWWWESEPTVTPHACLGAMSGPAGA
jgi:hypothetical protein